MMRRFRLRRAGGCAIAAAAVVVTPLGVAAPAHAAEGDPFRLIAASPTVTVFRERGQPVFVESIGTYLVAGTNPLEVRAGRSTYRDPFTAQWESPTGPVALPTGVLSDLSGLPDFFRFTLTNASGTVVHRELLPFCPNSFAAQRSRPDAPSSNPYPEFCGGFNRFAFGTVWGVQAGWGTPTSQFTVLDIPNGTYTARVRVTQPYRDAFGVDITSATTTLTVRVRTGTPQFGARLQAESLTIAPRADGPSMRPGARPNATSLAPQDARPDLRSLPAWELTTVHRRNRGDYLRFAANVWNAGPSPLVVDGFRQPGEPLMDAYQIFYDAGGNQVGSAPTGTLAYDTRRGHEHWHFTDFARYRILDADRRPVVLSGKEAFCLAPTDDIDLRVPGANWRPGQTGLSTACGGETALSIREVLDVGWGDTYAQFIPGQAFNITDLPNGRYFVEVTANPDGRLFETDMSNNTALRRIRLGGTPGNRTVTALPFQGIAAP